MTVKKRVVVDTNILISGLLFPHSLPGKIIRWWIKNQFILLTSDFLLNELEKTISKPKFLREFPVTKLESQALLALIKKYGKFVNTKNQISVQVRDPKDEKVLLTALSGNAGYLVTGDKDLLELPDTVKLGTLRILTAKEFLDIFNTD